MIVTSMSTEMAAAHIRLSRDRHFPGFHIPGNGMLILPIHFPGTSFAEIIKAQNAIQGQTSSRAGGKGTSQRTCGDLGMQPWRGGIGQTSSAQSPK